jgi:hypothetical protein
MWYTTLSGRWCDVIVLNVHTPAEDKIEDMDSQNLYLLGHLLMERLTVKLDIF